MDLSRKSHKLSRPEKPLKKLRLLWFQDMKGQSYCKILLLETSSSLRYIGNYSTRNWPRKFREFRERAPGEASNSRFTTKIKLFTRITTFFPLRSGVSNNPVPPCTTLFKETFVLAGNLRNSSLDLALASWRRIRQDSCCLRRDTAETENDLLHGDIIDRRLTCCRQPTIR